PQCAGTQCQPRRSRTQWPRTQMWRWPFQRQYPGTQTWPTRGGGTTTTRGGGGAALISTATDAAWLAPAPNAVVAAIRMQRAIRRSDMLSLLRKSRFALPSERAATAQKRLPQYA